MARARSPTWRGWNRARPPSGRGTSGKRREKRSRWKKSSPGPNRTDGRRTTCGTPDASTAACPSPFDRRNGYGLPLEAPMALRCTSFRTPARSASATTARVPRAFVRSKLPCRSVGMATVWTTASMPANAPDSDGGSVTSAPRTSGTPAGSSAAARTGSCTSARMSGGAASSSSRPMSVRPTKPFAPVIAMRIGDILRQRSNTAIVTVAPVGLPQPKQNRHADDHIREAEELRLLQSGDDDRVEPEARRGEPEAAVQHEVEPEDPALRLAPADPPPVPEQEPEDQQIDEEVVGGD